MVGNHERLMSGQGQQRTMVCMQRLSAFVSITDLVERACDWQVRASSCRPHRTYAVTPTESSSDHSVLVL